jgi:TolB-like protein/DNA-binding SARP family transcriptional activator
VVTGVVGGVETVARAPTALDIRLLGPMTIRRAGVELELPASRKSRALIAYLALAPRAHTRTHLSDLLGDIADDPRGDLRWCLSKARLVLDEAGLRRICTARDTVQLDLAGCAVDAADVETAMRAGIATLEPGRLGALARRFAGDFLEGLDLDRSPHLEAWLVAQRRRLRACHVALLEQLVKTQAAGSDEAFSHLETWLQLAPLDGCAHQAFLNALLERGQVREAEEHLGATVRAFEAEGLDARALRDRWREARARRATRAAPPPAAPTMPAEPPDSLPPAAARRASIAVMPFSEHAEGKFRGGLADGLVHDIITRLAKLRSLFVIAQGTVFALDERRVGAAEAGRTLNVDYVVGGSLRRRADRIVVSAELTETRSARIVWAETFEQQLDDTFALLDDIGNRIVASIDSEIEAAERNRAVLKPPSSLDAWEAHHRGLWHMYRFNEADNRLARRFFESAVRLDPTFARAHAGLSFTHFQSAFQHWPEPANAIDRAYAAASQSLLADERDPAAHWAMGRALWLRGRQQPALAELDTAVQLSPSFALGHYTLAFVHSQSGDPQAAIGFSDRSRSLSPYDPLLFGMLGARAMALARLRRFDEAAEWALKAAARPNAHIHIEAIAACCLALAGRIDEAGGQLAAMHVREPHYRANDFFDAFRFDAEGRALFASAAHRIGLD